MLSPEQAEQGWGSGSGLPATAHPAVVRLLAEAEAPPLGTHSFTWITGWVPDTPGQAHSPLSVSGTSCWGGHLGDGPELRVGRGQTEAGAGLRRQDSGVSALRTASLPSSGGVEGKLLRAQPQHPDHHRGGPLWSCLWEKGLAPRSQLSGLVLKPPNTASH